MPTYEVAIGFPECSFDDHERFLERQLTGPHSRLHAFSRRDDDGVALIFRENAEEPSVARRRAQQTAAGIFVNRRAEVESVREVDDEMNEF